MAALREPGVNMREAAVSLDFTDFQTGWDLD
jgi:hypothetical protein